ncbi:hypothetical protein THAOC_18874 [Thalassiosira oceanica]|uniref:Uncharacterized protein n=1 Tax=Thalassiosira oceanica TaxID=159749 RepID=K0S3W0_THAOC|nr:hypothetical protein THAOC_18874 [Thalassiosira oceanica]|eukprot:EJK60723.1 hypothetical protein THAOC_18874 [Thalassiosira oceanica]
MGHGIHVIVFDKMICLTPHLLLVSGVTRGGWDCKSDTMLFHYITNKLHVAKAGKMLKNELKKFRNTMADTLLMYYYRETKAALGADSPLIRAIHRVAIDRHRTRTKPSKSQNCVTKSQQQPSRLRNHSLSSALTLGSTKLRLNEKND